LLNSQQTTFEYLLGCWKRLNAASSTLNKVSEHLVLLAQLVNVRFLQGYSPAENRQAIDILTKIRDLVVSYAGLTLQEPEMFPQPSGYDATVLVDLSITSLSADDF
jgi:ubiquitin conjugation factor E4 B